MSRGPESQEIAPGEARRDVRLVRPPGDGYRQRQVARADEPPHPGRGAVAGLIAAAGTAFVSGALSAVLDVDLGLIVVAALGGWIIGVAVARGTWRSPDHPPWSVPRAVAATLGAVAWLGAGLVDWIVSQAILPASERGLFERLAATPFLDWLAPQLSLVDGLEVLLLVVVAWRSAR